MDYELGIVSLLSLLATGILAAVALFLGHFVLGKETLKDQPKIEKWVLSWLVFDALIHFLLEGPFVVISLTSTVNSSSSSLALLWKEYGKSDARWLVSDPTIVSLEFLTVVVDGTLCILTIVAIITQAYYRHYVQLALCICELYGGWMTFCPEWLTGSPNLNTNSMMYLWVYLVFFNGLWVVIPLLLMYQSWLDMKDAYLCKQDAAKPYLGTPQGAKYKKLTGTKGRKEY